MNYAGASFESAAGTMAALGDIALLQDTVDEDVVGTWAPTYRDVVILDSNNEFVEAFNLTSHSLAVQNNYDTLKQKLIDAKP